MDKKYYTKEGKRELQKLLIAKGFSVGKAGADGILGKDTGKAVREFQKKHGLATDGILGDKTIAALLRGTTSTPPTTSVPPSKESPRTTTAQDTTATPDISQYEFEDPGTPPRTAEELKARQGYLSKLAQSGFRSPMAKRAKSSPKSKPNIFTNEMLEEGLMKQRASKVNTPTIQPNDMGFFEEIAAQSTKLPKAFEKGDGLLQELTGAAPLSRVPGRVQSAAKDLNPETAKNLLLDILSSIPLAGAAANTGKALSKAGKASKELLAQKAVVRDYIQPVSKASKSDAYNTYSNFADRTFKNIDRAKKGWETRRANAAAKPNKNLGGFLQSVSPLLSAIPGAGAIGAGAGMLGGMLGQPEIEPQVLPQENTNRFGYAYGGQMQQQPVPPSRYSAKDNPNDKNRPVFGKFLAPLLGLGAAVAGAKPLVQGMNNLKNSQSNLDNIDFTGASYGYTLPQKAQPFGQPLNQSTLDWTINHNPGQEFYEQPVAAKYGGRIKNYAYGGELNKVSSNTVEVNGNNPNQTDGVELPSAYVDHGETITGSYVFSDKLKNPLSGNTFAKDNKVLANSDKQAEKKMNDPEARNTLKYNNIFRDILTKTNDLVRVAKEGKEAYSNGGQMKKGYVDGGNDPLLALLQPTVDRDYMQNQYTGAMNTYARRMPPPDRLPQIPTGQFLEGWGTPEFHNTQAYDPDYISKREGTYKDPSTLPQNDKVGIPDSPTTPKTPLGDMLQYGELAAKAALLGRGYDKQELYQNNSPINMQQYDPSQAINQNQRSFNAFARGVNNSSTAGARMSNLQQGYANRYNADSRVISQYDERNKAAQTQYEDRLGMREDRNIQRRYATDQIRQQDEAAYFNQLYDILGSAGNIGRGKTKQKENQKAVKLLLSAYPDIAKYIKP